MSKHDEAARELLTTHRLSATHNMAWLSSALRDAERAGMERAAKVAEETMLPILSNSGINYVTGNPVAAAIRALAKEES